MATDKQTPATNEFDQPVGPDLAGWTAPGPPPATSLVGAYMTLEPMNAPVHGPALFEAFVAAPPSLWTYLPWGPYREAGPLIEMLASVAATPDWQSYAVVVDGAPIGFCSYLRIAPGQGTIEIGGIAFSPALQQTRAATEALSLLIRNSFALGYRRCEWKCDDLNAPSRRAAQRLGYRYEGTWLKATHYKGRSRDTAWYAIIDDDAPDLVAGYDAWLAPTNFDDAGHQLTTLESYR